MQLLPAQFTFNAAESF